jgi:hypothetical protein
MDPPCSAASFEVNSEPHTRARLSVRLSSQVNTLPKAKSKTRSKQNKDMHKKVWG